MTFFIGIAGPWIVVAILALLSINRDRDLARDRAAQSTSPDGASSQGVAHSAYLA